MLQHAQHAAGQGYATGTLQEDAAKVENYGIGNAVQEAHVQATARA